MEQSFPVEKEYTWCVTTLNRTGILMLLPKSESVGVIGRDGKEYPIPTQGDVGRVRLDMHRTGNKRCTKSWGGSSTVRLLTMP